MFKSIQKALHSIRDYGEKYPLVFMSIMFGFALSYKSMFTYGTNYFHLFLIVNSLVSFIFLTILTKYFIKIVKHKGDKFTKKFVFMNSFLLFYLTIVSNGLILFLDTANFRIKHGSKYAPFKEKFGRHGVREEAMYHALFTLILIILTGIFYSLNSFMNNIVIESLFRLSLWSMFWSVIPVAGIFALFTMDLAGRASKFLDVNIDFERAPTSTGGTIFFVGQRRIWPFFAAFVLFFSMMLLGKINLFNAAMSSLLVALISVIAWLIFYEYGLKETVIR